MLTDHHQTYHTISINETLQTLETSMQGLGEEEVRKRHLQYGPNELEQQKKKSPWVLLLHQFTDFMIIVLMAAAVISGLIGDPVDSVIILVIVLLNAILGFVQEYRAEKA